MDQFMNREQGIQAIQDAIKLLESAQGFLHEREDGRENLHGGVSGIVGGAIDGLSGLVDLLDDGVAATGALFSRS